MLSIQILIDCKSFFRFQKEDLRELIELLRLPAIVTLGNRCTGTGENVFLRGLYELTTGETQYNIAANVFGRDQSYQSYCLKYFIDHVFDNFQHLLTNNLEWWHDNGFFEASRAAIAAKVDLPDNEYAFFIDCNCMSCRVTGGGPAEGGVGAARWDKTLQQAFYNGWKSTHGLKHQTLDIAHGFTVDLFGPTSLRRNDLELLRDSRINERIGEVQAGDVDHVKIFGDSAYKVRSHMRSYYKLKDLKNVLTDDKYATLKDWNYKMKTVRISIE